MARGSVYLKVLRGLRGEAAQNQLIGYLKGERRVSYPSRQGNRPANQFVFVDTFGLPLTAGVKLRQTVRTTGYSAVSPFFGARVTTTAPTQPENILIVKGLRNPRAVITTGRDDTGTEATSEKTGLPYKSYGGNAISVPFGPATSGETEGEAFAVIKANAITEDARNTAVYVPGSYVA